MKARITIWQVVGVFIGAATISYSNALISDPLIPYLGGSLARMIGAGLWVGAFLIVAMWLESKLRR